MMPERKPFNFQPDGSVLLSALLSDPLVTDIHLTPSVDGATGSRLLSGWVRSSGLLLRLHQVDDDMDESLRKRIWDPSASDSSLTIANGKRLRFSKRTIFERAAREVFIRILPAHIPMVIHDLADLMGPVLVPLSGIFIVSGTAGSGKSTLLASLAQHYLESAGAHIVTIEDPIEYIFESSVRGYASQRDVGTDVPAFAEGVKMALREDPDIILVGEIRDADTAHTALTAAETGHMVLATVHAPDLFGAVERYLALLGQSANAALRFSDSYIGGAHIESTPGNRRDSGVRRTYEIFFSNNASKNLIRERKTHLLYQAHPLPLRKTLGEHPEDCLEDRISRLEERTKKRGVPDDRHPTVYS